MDKNWMYLQDRQSKEYVDGVKSFLELAKESTRLRIDEVRCPCGGCKNCRTYNLQTIESHLYRYGFVSNYKRWIFHGEEIDYTTTSPPEDFNVMFDDDNLEDNVGQPMFPNNIFEDELLGGACEGERSESEAINFANLFAKARSLSSDCNKMLALDFLAKLMHLKVSNKWSENSFNMLLQLLKGVFPEGTNFPTSYHDSKQMLRDFGFGYELIHACKYDCALFWKEHASCEKCPTCDEPRYKYENGKGKKIPQKVLYYLPLKPRLQRLYMTKLHATDMRWHKEKHVSVEGEMKHPADTEQWKDFDKQYPWFAQDARNVRLGLATKGFNPFKNTNSSYKLWPVTLVPYNLPPTKCMDESFFMTTLLIPGPESPGREIDVFLRPLIDELKDLWSNGVETRDHLTGETFQLRACVLWTISDFITYESLSGWSLSTGFFSCPICQRFTDGLIIRDKMCFSGHRSYLPPGHSWRKHRQYKANWFKDDALPPEPVYWENMLVTLDSLPIKTPGKNPNNENRMLSRYDTFFYNWMKKSIFFELEYWATLKVRHNLDVMYVEKNFCDSIIGTLLNMEGMTKDTNRDRKDLSDLDIREELHFKLHKNRLLKPPACYTLSKTRSHCSDPKTSFCKFFKSVKLPDAYAIDISKKVSIKNKVISGLEAYDCHVILQRLLPPAVDLHYIHEDITITLTELSNFFQKLCAKTLLDKDLDKLQERIALILCKFEKIYPPSFFDIIVHLAVHLPHEAKLVGPVGFRWTYPFERNWEKLTKYVRKNCQPEGSIVEAYIANEAVRFCSIYGHDIDTYSSEKDDNLGPKQTLPSFRVFSHHVKPRVQPFGHEGSVKLSREMLQQAHWFVLLLSDELVPYVKEHKKELKAISDVNLEERHNEEFPAWLANHVKRLRQTEPTKVSDELFSLAIGPDFEINTYSGCVVGGVRFLTEEKDSHRIAQNSGLYSISESEGKVAECYGSLCNVWELKYSFGHRVVLFKAKWFDTDPEAGTPSKCNITQIRVKVTYDTAFVLAKDAEQTIYLNGNFGLKYAQKVRPRLFWDVHETSSKMEVDKDDNADDDLNSCNFQWNEQIDDIAMKSLVHQYGEAEVISDDVVPNLRKEAVGLPAEMFDDAWFKNYLAPDERPWVNYTGSESDNDNISFSSSDYDM
ncbi:uncharacterized protein LOC115699180 [Cannabis sativa]|uniref:uncharacterized protein LOC115699180 n=1 Tax=Cannabis sativa TaxID=3483 RepID=UPI0029C9CFBA|nr:uncharacterized protein LOC115699180 [Cannabis sativa]